MNTVRKLLSVLLALLLLLASFPMSLAAAEELEIPAPVAGKFYSIMTRWEELSSASDRALYAAAIMEDAAVGLEPYGFQSSEVDTILVYGLSSLVLCDMYQGSTCWSFMIGNGLHVTREENHYSASDPVGTMAYMCQLGVYEGYSVISPLELKIAQQKLYTMIFSGNESVDTLFRNATDIIGVREGFVAFNCQEHGGFIAPDGTAIHDESWNYVTAFNGSGYACVYTGPFMYNFPSGGVYGVINKQGELVLPMEFSSYNFCTDGVINLVKDGVNCFFDSRTQELITIEGFDYVAWRYSNGAVAVFNGELDASGKPATGKWGYANLLGEVVIPVEWEYVSYSAEDGLYMCKQNGMYGVINAESDIVVPFEYKEVSISDNYIAAKTETEYFIFDRTGKLIHSKPLAPDTYSGMTGDGYLITNQISKSNTAILWKPDGSRYFEETHGYYYIRPNGLMRIQQYDETGRSHYGLYDMNAGELIVPIVWDEIGYTTFDESTYRVKLNGLYGFIRTDGTPITEAIYEDAYYMVDGIAAVKLDNQWHLIDAEGNIIY